MKALFLYCKQYYQSLNKQVFLFTTLFVALLIVLNFSFGIESRLANANNILARFSGFFLLYLFTFSTAYWIHFAFTKHFWPPGFQFYFLLVLSAFLFAFKISAQQFSAPLTASLGYPWNKYWQVIIDWPLKAAVFLFIIALTWKFFDFDGPVAGLSMRNFKARPYLILLLLMLPLIGFAATQPDFQLMYPKLKTIAFIDPFVHKDWLYHLFYQLSYGSDFFSIELFFRGFLVLAFVRFAGKDAILPMAAFYCTIHFGKPLLECISSYPGGIILGVVVYRTQTIWGGLLVHLGIAWLMELGGSLAK
jgi:hypothetical protein